MWCCKEDPPTKKTPAWSARDYGHFKETEKNDFACFQTN